MLRQFPKLDFPLNAPNMQNALAADLYIGCTLLAFLGWQLQHGSP